MGKRTGLMMPKSKILGFIRGWLCSGHNNRLRRLGKKGTESSFGVFKVSLSDFLLVFRHLTILWLSRIGVARFLHYLEGPHE